MLLLLLPDAWEVEVGGRLSQGATTNGGAGGGMSDIGGGKERAGRARVEEGDDALRVARSGRDETKAAA